MWQQEECPNANVIDAIVVSDVSNAEVLGVGWKGDLDRWISDVSVLAIIFSTLDGQKCVDTRPSHSYLCKIDGQKCMDT